MVAAVKCPGCGDSFTPSGRRRWCTDACKQAAWRQRTTSPVLPPPRSVLKAEIVYECPSCGNRSLGDQRCPDCNLFSQRIGPGGPCPHCDEPVAISDLTTN